MPFSLARNFAQAARANKITRNVINRGFKTRALPCLSGERDRRRSFYGAFTLSHGETGPCVKLFSARLPGLSSTVPHHLPVIITDIERVSEKVVWRFGRLDWRSWNLWNN